MTEAARAPDLRMAIAASNLRSLPADVLEGLTAAAHPVRIASGTTLHHEADERPHLYLVVHGLVRVYVAGQDGRAMTVRYCRPGALLGVATLYAGALPPFGIQAVSDADLLSFPSAVIRAAADRDPRVARALLTETSERVASFVVELSGRAFSSVAQRVARHLLDLASDEQQPGFMVARTSQQQLADSVGTVREVVVRVLRDFRERGIVTTGSGGIVIVDPERLARLGTSGWNESS